MKLNALLELIASRRAVYPVQYNSEAVSKQEVEHILAAANWAPTHRRTEPWRFKVFRGEAKLELGKFLAEKYGSTAVNYSEFKQRKMVEKAGQASVIIAICMQRDPDQSLPEWEEIAATAMAVQNMWLAAHSLKIGAYWSSPALITYFGEHLKLAHGERCLGFFYMGKYDGALPEGHRKTPIEVKTTWV